ncbi:hypothetical protein AL755_13580 [Arthrobacter sp. ERGS1:01]|uniref:GrpB family protein n=1 Tax=Arthrobacter sp. ERGS1:01 TaxID=1704044 RepID=UPI0006B5926B|nr:GrpB family protein [Arthrobacter sp. ERGS1:01]ALE06248.1 hypothetical protein AL755_13580 [Arthrobacter sp. ERGS1:01]
MNIEVVPYSSDWAKQFDDLADELRSWLQSVPVVAIEHVGSTAVPGLFAKPVLDVDIIVRREDVNAAITALTAAGYAHEGDLGVTDREAFIAPDQDPVRHVYVGVENTLHVRNHLAVRNTLRQDSELRNRYAQVKRQLASDSEMEMSRYVAGKSEVLQDVLAASDLTAEEKQQIYELNNRP